MMMMMMMMMLFHLYYCNYHKVLSFFEPLRQKNTLTYIILNLPVLEIRADTSTVQKILPRLAFFVSNLSRIECERTSNAIYLKISLISIQRSLVLHSTMCCIVLSRSRYFLLLLNIIYRHTKKNIIMGTKVGGRSRM